MGDDEERDFDFICRNCGHEVILMTTSFTDPSVWIEQWLHALSHVADCWNSNYDPTGTFAEPTRWTECA